MRRGDARIATDTSFCIAMHCATSSGGKDWYGQVNNADDTITTCWGPTDNAHSCASKHGNAAALNKLVNEKISKGYCVVDRWNAAGGNWDSALNQAPVAPPPPVAETARRTKAPNIMKGLAKPKEALKYDF